MSTKSKMVETAVRNSDHLFSSGRATKDDNLQMRYMMAFNNERTIVSLAEQLQVQLRRTEDTLAEIARKLETSLRFNGCGEMQNEQRNINILTARLNELMDARGYYKDLLED